MSHKILTIAQHKGGAGKTTIAAHLAVAFSQMGKKVTAIDIDPQKSFSKWYDLRKDKSYTQFNFKTISGWHLLDEIQANKDNTDVFIIDTPPQTEEDTKIAIKSSDLVLIPVQLSPFDVWATEQTIDSVNEERIPHRILLNRVSPNTNLLKLISKDFNKTLETKIGNRVRFASTMMDGLTVTESSLNSTAASEINNLAKEVDNLLFPLDLTGEKAA